MAPFWAGATPLLHTVSVAKVMPGVAPALKEISCSVSRACAAGFQTEEVKKVRNTLCTFKLATSSPEVRPTEFVLKDLRRLSLRKSPRKIGQIGREGTPSRREIAARSLRASGVTPASCCWNTQLVFWPRSKKGIRNFVRQDV